MSGAVLLLPNHPNALLDPAIVWATAGRDVRFLAKSTLFEGAFAPVLKGAGAIPVYRRLDQGVDPSRNTETFEAVHRALAEGQAVCIFPEGVSHSAGKLAPLRTGAARMALGAERQRIPVQLVAVGLNFDRKTTFRSRATVLYGRPFSVEDLATGTADDQIAVRLVTDRIAMQMRRLVVEADPETDAALVTRVERLYAAARGRAASPQERVARRQAIAVGIDRLRRANESKFMEIALRLRRYDQRLRRFRLRDRHLDWDVSMGAAIRFVVREAAAGIILLPLAAAGLALFWVPYQLTGLLARRATSEHDVAATAKVFVGAAVYGVWMILIVGLIWYLAGGLGGDRRGCSGSHAGSRGAVCRGTRGVHDRHRARLARSAAGAHSVAREVEAGTIGAGRPAGRSLRLAQRRNARARGRAKAELMLCVAAAMTFRQVLGGPLALAEPLV